MTLIVAVKCADGIVVGADGAATLGVAGQFTTVRQPVRKLTIVQNQIIVGTAGPVGLGQRLAHEVGSIWTSKKLIGQAPEQAMTTLRTEFFDKHLGFELHAAGIASKAIGPAAQLSACCYAVIAMPVSSRLCLFQFDAQGSPEMATADLPFVAIGSGQQIADPFLAFLRRVLWRHEGNAHDPLPSLGDGIMATLWTLNHAIETNPGGVAKPTQLVILRQGKNGFEARELEEAECDEHLQYIAETEQALGDCWARIKEQPKGGDAPAVPTPN